MTLVKNLFISFLFIGASLMSRAQTDIIDLGGPKFVTLSAELPANLTAERVVVVISVPPDENDRFQIRGEWQKLARISHKYFRQIGIDPVGYIYKDDINAGPEVRNAYLSLLESRKVKNIVSISQIGQFSDANYTMEITPFVGESFVSNGQSAWKESHNELERVMVRLGRQVLRQQLVRSNFLIPEHPEYLNDLVVFQGTRLENYPSRLQGLGLAVVAFQEVKIEPNMDQQLLDQISQYNTEVARKNERIKEIMKAYPFKYDLVQETDESKLYDSGYQYALMSVSSTGRSVKRILNYPSSKSETHYVSATISNEGETALKRIPVQANITKYYIKQTIVKDVHTGKVWDADAPWEEALRNYILNLRKAFKK